MPQPVKVGSYVADIEECPRCLERHSRVTFKELRIPSKDYNYYANCPATHEPIVAFVEITIPPPVRKEPKEPKDSDPPS